MENLPHTNTAELVISLVCLAVLVPVKEINIRYRKRLRTPIPVEILTVSQLISSRFTFDPVTLRIMADVDASSGDHSYGGGFRLLARH